MERWMLLDGLQGKTVMILNVEHALPYKRTWLFYAIYINHENANVIAKDKMSSS